jgi:hypothetical protein
MSEANTFFDFDERNPTDIGDVVNGYMDILSDYVSPDILRTLYFEGGEMDDAFKVDFDGESSIFPITINSSNPFEEGLKSDFAKLFSPHEYEYRTNPDFELKLMQYSNSAFFDKVVAVDKVNGLVFVFNHNEYDNNPTNRLVRDANFEQIIVFDYENQRVVEIENPDSDREVDQVRISEFDFSKFENGWSRNEDYRRMSAVYGIYNYILDNDYQTYNSEQSLLDNYAVDFIELRGEGFMKNIFFYNQGDDSSPNETIRLNFSGSWGNPPEGITNFDQMLYSRDGNYKIPYRPSSESFIDQCKSSSIYNHSTLESRQCNIDRMKCLGNCDVKQKSDKIPGYIYGFSRINDSAYITRPDVDMMGIIINNTPLNQIQRQDIFPNK